MAEQQPKEWKVNHARDASTVADMQAMANMNSMSMAALEKTSTQLGSTHDNASERISEKMSGFSSGGPTSDKPPQPLDQATASSHIGTPTHTADKGKQSAEAPEPHPMLSYNDQRAQQYLFVRNRRAQFIHNVMLTLVVALLGVVPGALRLSGDPRGADIAMVVLGGVAGLIMAMHCIMLFWDKAELAFAKERRLAALAREQRQQAAVVATEGADSV